MRRPTAALSWTLLFTAAGCAAVGVIADKVAPPSVDPVYVLGKTTQTLVVAENFRTPSETATDADRIAKLVSDQLAEKEAALMVSQEKLDLLRDARPGAFRKMSVVDIAKAVGAQEVLYIDFAGVGVGAQPGSDMLKAVGHANVKVIDVAAGQVLFPKDMSEGLPIAFETPMRRATDVTNSDSMRSEAVIGLSGKISRLFYKYQPSDLEAIDQGH